MLADVVSQEMPRVESEKIRLIVSMAEDRKKLKDT